MFHAFRERAGQLAESDPKPCLEKGIRSIKKVRRRFFDERASQDQQIHPAGTERPQGVARRVHHGFAPQIKRRIE